MVVVDAKFSFPKSMCVIVEDKCGTESNDRVAIKYLEQT